MLSTANRREKLRIGIFGIGLEAYWAQFASLQQRLTGYLHLIEERLGQLSALAYYYRGLEGNENEQVTAGMIMGNSLLPTSGRCCASSSCTMASVALASRFECKVKVGSVSILGVTQQGDGRLKFLVAGGDCVPGPTFRIDNTNSRIRFPLDPATFVTRWSEEGPTHHCALGIGDQVGALLKVGHLLDVPSVRM